MVFWWFTTIFPMLFLWFSPEITMTSPFSHGPGRAKVPLQAGLRWGWWPTGAEFLQTKGKKPFEHPQNAMENGMDETIDGSFCGYLWESPSITTKISWKMLAVDETIWSYMVHFIDLWESPSRITIVPLNVCCYCQSCFWRFSRENGWSNP